VAWEEDFEVRDQENQTLPWKDANSSAQSNEENNWCYVRGGGIGLKLKHQAEEKKVGERKKASSGSGD